MAGWPGKPVAARGLVNGGTASKAQRWDEAKRKVCEAICLRASLTATHAAELLGKGGEGMMGEKGT